MSPVRRRLVALATLCAALFLALSTAHAQVFVRQWGSQGSGPGQFNGARDLGVDLAGNVFVLDFWNTRIQKFDSHGAYLGEIAGMGSEPGQHQVIYGMWVTPAGHVWTADPSNNRITEFDGDGHYLRHFETPQEDYVDGQFGAPMDVAVDGSGNFYVVEFDTPRVQKFDSAGHFLLKWSKPESREGLIGLDSFGHVYTAESPTRCVVRWSTDGVQLGSVCLDQPGPFEAWGFACDAAGVLYVSCGSTHGVRLYSPSDAFLRQFGSSGTGPGEFLGPTGLAFNADGHLFVADQYAQRVQEFAFPPVPTLPTTWGRLKSIYR